MQAKNQFFTDFKRGRASALTKSSFPLQIKQEGNLRYLGYFYAKGQGVEKDYAEAVKWFRKAAEQGDAIFR